MPEPVILPPQTFLSRRRGLLIALLVAVVGGGSLAVAAAAYLTRLPSPEEADRTGLVRWLVVTDLRTEPLELQLRLLNRVEQELAAGIDLNGALAQLSPEQRQQLAANVERLGECWFLRSADAYFAVPAADRSAVLAQQVARIAKLRIFEQLELVEGGAAAMSGLPASVPAANYLAALSHNVQRVERWISAAPAAQRQPLQAYFDVLRSRMLWSRVEKWLF